MNVFGFEESDHGSTWHNSAGKLPSVTSSYLVRNAQDLNADILRMMKTSTLKILALVDSKRKKPLLRLT